MLGTKKNVRQWKSTAGPIQTKKVDRALRDLRWHGTSVKRITDYGEHIVNELCGDTNPEVDKALNEIFDAFSGEITRENFNDVIAACQRAIKEVPMRVSDERTTAEERKQREIDRKEAEEKRSIESKRKADKTAEIVAKLRAEYPWAIPSGTKDGTGRERSEHARCAANIRELLRRKYPGIEFKVTSRTASMMTAVDVRWENGPTGKEVDAVVCYCKHGSFDGMQDMYVDDHSAESSAYAIVFGQAKYVSCDRDYSKETFEIVCRSLCEKQKVEYVDTYTRNVFGSNDTQNISDYFYRMWSQTSLPAGAKVTGVEHADSNDPNYREPYRITFEVPASVAEADGDSTATGTGSAKAHVETHFHTKKQKTFYLVVLNDRVGDQEFDRIRDKCREFGGWYSRKWGKCPTGFGFETKQAADRFCESL